MFGFTRSHRSLLAVLSFVVATPLFASPPWLSVELGPSPWGSTRGSILVIHATHHGTPVSEGVTATAEGIVGGQRRTITLTVTPTGAPGAFAVRKQWPDGGVWVLTLSLNVAHEDIGEATVLVSVGADGQIGRVQTLTKRMTDGDMGPRGASRADVEAALRALMPK